MIDWGFWTVIGLLGMFYPRFAFALLLIFGLAHGFAGH